MTINHVEGENKGHVMLYALSTCGWCKRTKGLLEDMKVDFYYTEVDLLQGTERAEAIDAIKKWNPRCSFPSLVYNDSQCIIGFDEAKIKEILK
ncbi:MAG: glutaredoxin family protein [Deltaproteobacteria bacterium]|jgi:glutaredoxin-like protein NrdH|nr:glutaredoxin family protein [Deltaproteobacteria bacterium]